MKMGKTKIRRVRKGIEGKKYPLIEETSGTRNCFFKSQHG